MIVLHTPVKKTGGFIRQATSKELAAYETWKQLEYTSSKEDIETTNLITVRVIKTLVK